MRLVEAIQQTVRRFPANISVEDSEERLTYQEMWDRASLASHLLSDEKAGYVMIQEPRSCQLIVKLLAVWLAGHAPLLLDPETPACRVRELRRLVRPVEFEDPRSSLGVEYLVTTSGSSGRPKVVQIGDGSLHRVIRYQTGAFQLDCRSSVAWILSPGFDASLSDLGTALCSGARLVCLKSPFPDRLESITHLDIPPALLQVYRPGDFPSTLQTLVVGGEASRPELLRSWAKYHRLVAVYGPSETTVCSSAAVVDENWDQSYIGQPLPGVKYAVDGDELLIGGPTVGLGYLDEPGPFPQRDGVRWYRTGDKVGPAHVKFGYHFLGRLDRQVQLRGQRFEPEEVEQRAKTLLKTEAACEVWKGQVVLCWQTRGEPCSEEKSLRTSLDAHLMPGWLPQHYVPMQKLPRNTSAKIDRAQLRALLDSRLAEQLTSLERLSLDLQSELQVEDSRPGNSLEGTSPKRRSRRSLLVTGMTGRLGRALEPLLRDHYEVWSLQRHPAGDHSFLADLTAPDFGLAQDEWDVLKRETDEILHLAGHLDLSLDLESLRPLNVNPMAALLSLDKPVHYASTLAVPLCTDNVLFGGYAQSKWLAEQELRDTPGLTLRYGHLMGPPRADELLAIVVRGLASLGHCPCVDDPRLCFDWTPIEWAAQTTLQLLAGNPESRQTWPVRRGWHFHLNDLARLLQNRELIKLVDAATFFKLKPCDREAALAQAALWKCQSTPKPANRGFDLFLLGNSPKLLKRSQPGPEKQLARYIEKCRLLET